MFSVSRGQRISSRCGAVKSVLCPKRLVMSNALQPFGFICLYNHRVPRSVPTPPLLRHQSPPSAVAPCASAAGWTQAGKARGTAAHSPPRPETLARRGGSSLSQPLSRRRSQRTVQRSGWFRTPWQAPFLSRSLRPCPPPTEPDWHRAAPQSPSAVWAAELVEPQGPRRKIRLFAQPHLWGSAQRAGAGRGDGVLTPPAPPLSPLGRNQEPPLP